MQNVVVSDENSAKSAIAYLKKINGGRIIEVKILEEKDATRPFVESDDETLPIHFYNFQRKVPIETSKTFRHLKILPSLKCKVVVVDDTSCKEGIQYDPKASHEIIIHENVDVPVQEITYAIYCNEHGFHFKASVCTPGSASCYQIDHVVSFDGKLSTQLLE